MEHFTCRLCLCFDRFEAIVGEKRHVKVHKGANRSNLISLIGIHLTEERPQELATLSQHVSESHTPGCVPRILLEVIFEALYKIAHRQSII